MMLSSRRLPEINPLCEVVQVIEAILARGSLMADEMTLSEVFPRQSGLVFLARRATSVRSAAVTFLGRKTMSEVSRFGGILAPSRTWRYAA